jgi:hypothetical protein
MRKYGGKLFLDIILMQVINAYIHLLRTQGNMLSRQGGRCYLENTSLSQLMMADGEENHCMEERYPCDAPGF